jgi:hypothetical protein
MIVIDGADLDPGLRKRMIIDASEIFRCTELPRVEGGTGLRRFQLFRLSDDKYAGIIYEDDIPATLLKE